MYEPCARCQTLTIAYDGGTGVMACESCGLVLEETVLQNPEFNEDCLRIGTYMGGCGTAASTLGRGSIAMRHRLCFCTDHKRKLTLDKVDQLASMLCLPKDKLPDVRHLIKLVTDDAWAAGEWTSILVGGCIYVVARRNRLLISAAEVCIAANCGLKVLMRMYFRISEFADIHLPGIDLCAFFDKIISHHEAFNSLEKDTFRKICKQGHMLLNYGIEWFVSTGRHPLAVVAAVVVLVAAANNIEKVDLYSVSQDLHVNHETACLRLKEFREALVHIGQKLPWDKDITLKAVDRHLPFLLQYLQIKNGKDANKTITASLQAMVVRCPPLALEDMAARRLAKALYMKYDGHFKKSMGTQSYVVREDADCETSGKEYVREDLDGREDVINADLSARQDVKGADMDHCMEKVSTLFKRRKLGTPELFLIEGNENSASSRQGDKSMRPPAWESLPPSFIANRTACSRLHLKVNAAKKRISNVLESMKNEIAELTFEPLMVLNEHQALALTCRELLKRVEGLDAEDCLIEYLLLRGANERLIETGHYNLLLSSPPVQPDREEVTDEEIMKYLKSLDELDFLLSISQEEPLSPFVEDRFQ